jgi:hypothetical protein
MMAERVAQAEQEAREAMGVRWNDCNIAAIWRD